MPLRIVRRKDTGSLTISGMVAGQRVRRRAQTNDLALAREEAAAVEAEILRTAWHGERRGNRAFDEAARSYLESAPRSEGQHRRVNRLVQVLGKTKLGTIHQGTAIELRRRLLRENAAVGSYVVEIIMPLRAILHHARRLGWCEVPHLIAPRSSPGRTLFLLPAEAERLIAATAPHTQALLIFLIGTGARMSEAVELEWRDVDLIGARAIFWVTKNGRRRVATLPPRTIEALTVLPHRDAAVFRTYRGLPYADRRRASGGQIKVAWKNALHRAGLDLALHPHDCRHTWASWHYALHRDLLALKVAGGWASITHCERYAHLLPAGYEDEIRRFLGVSPTCQV
jgi:integrase